MERLTNANEWSDKIDLTKELGYSHLWKRLKEYEDLIGIDHLRELIEAEKDSTKSDYSQNFDKRICNLADYEDTGLEPLAKSELPEMRGRAVLVAHADGSPMMYGMNRVAAVLDTVSIYGESRTGIVAIYGRGLTLSDSDYGITWIAYDYEPCEKSERLTKQNGCDFCNLGSAHIVHGNQLNLGYGIYREIAVCPKCGRPLKGESNGKTD